jgi:WhiB family redox-sensing transcriptional regulator
MRKGFAIHCRDTAWDPTTDGHPSLIVRVESPSLLHVSGFLDLATRDLLDAVLCGMTGGDVHLDVSQLEFADAAGLAAIAAADAARRREHRGRVVLHRARPMLVRTVTAAGLHRLLPWYESDDEDGDWRARSACADEPVAKFFDEAAPMPARRICWSCPVSGNCLSYALRTGQAFGIWGGLTARERSLLHASPALDTAGRGT